MIWNIQFKLERPDSLKEDDETWFDDEHIKSEIKTWLEDLDFRVKEIKCIKNKSIKVAKNLPEENIVIMKHSQASSTTKKT